MMIPAIQVLGYLGFAVIWIIVFLVVFKASIGLYSVYLAPILLPFKFEPTSDSWAIVTGSTDGIGLEYSKKLAEKGFHLLLISRNQKKLDRVRKEILEEYPSCPEIVNLAFDFQNLDYAPIEAAIANLPSIDILVNNVGHADWAPDYFTNIEPWEELEKTIRINIFSMTRLSYIVIPRMEVRRKGIIVNISSFSALVPTPCLAVYGATKSYMDYLSRALSVECHSKGIIIQSVLPQFVSTNMSQMKPGFGVPDAKTYVDASFKTIGYETRTSGYWNHRFKAVVVKIIALFSDSLMPHMILMCMLLIYNKLYHKYNVKIN
ncbi:very-long-chain 3-oxoacyl-CoA reductase-A-like [Brevipalpus obovatus]|uniref:very-long-chain 3-oxoacyl-CoA reductase-A-like n=1 Tax=Brevipalpus obovatus TaxID=246614 RepID=UPI003D9E481C